MLGRCQGSTLTRLCCLPMATPLRTVPLEEMSMILAQYLWCHGTRYVRHARGWYAYDVRTVRGASGQAALRLVYSTQEDGTRDRYYSAEALRDVRVSLAQYWPSSLVPDGRTVQCDPLMCGRSTCSSHPLARPMTCD